MIEKIEYNNRRIIINAYDVSTEKKLLWYLASVDVVDLDDMYMYLKNYIESNIQWKKLEDCEKYYIFYKLRSISVGDEIKLSCECPECQTKFNIKTDTQNLLNKKNIDNKIQKDFYNKFNIKIKNVFSNKIENYFFININNYKLKNFLEIEDFLSDKLTSFSFKKIRRCPQCKNEIVIDLLSPSIFNTMFSDCSMGDFYKLFTAVISKGNFDGETFLKLYPFEKEIILNQLENMNQKSSQN